MEGSRKGTQLYWSGDFGYVKDYIYKDKNGLEKTLHLKCRLYGKPYNCLGRGTIGLPNTDNSLLKHTKIHNCESKEEEKVSISRIPFQETCGQMKRNIFPIAKLKQGFDFTSLKRH